MWGEGGAEKRYVHVTRRQSENYAIQCASAPVMRSLIVKLAAAR